MHVKENPSIYKIKEIQNQNMGLHQGLFTYILFESRSMLDFTGDEICKSTRLRQAFAFSAMKFSAIFRHVCCSKHWIALKYFPQGSSLCFHHHWARSSLWKRLKVYSRVSGGEGVWSRFLFFIFQEQTCYCQVTLKFHFEMKLKLSSENLNWKAPNYRRIYV